MAFCSALVPLFAAFWSDVAAFAPAPVAAGELPAPTVVSGVWLLTPGELLADPAGCAFWLFMLFASGVVAAAPLLGMVAEELLWSGVLDVALDCADWSLVVPAGVPLAAFALLVMVGGPVGFGPALVGWLADWS